MLKIELEGAELEKWLAESDRLTSALDAYRARIVSAKWGASGWVRPRTEEELLFQDLFYFWSAALMNAGDIFGYLEFIDLNRDRFETIGAKGILAAYDVLLPLYEERSKLATEQERNEYCWRMAETIQQGEKLAEDPNVFAQLLLAYAQRNSHRIG